MLHKVKGAPVERDRGGKQFDTCSRLPLFRHSLAFLHLPIFRLASGISCESYLYSL